MNTEQVNMFDILYDKYKINKPIRLIEFFAGYGSQALALKYLGVPFQHWKICEWAVKSIQAYKDMHFPNTQYWKDTEDCTIPKEMLQELLYKVGISQNYNEPMTEQQIKRLSHEQLLRIYENIMITNNLVNIQNVKGKDLNLEEPEKFTYLLTYSFPCQDLSLAGKGKGMSDTSTRSGMLWELERILKECQELGTLPEILLMENVPQVHGKKNIEDFNKWINSLEEMGYTNYYQDLIATDYGIPQTRKRTFMVSILGNYTYEFPKPIPLTLKLKDMLEDDVDEQYYISDKMLNCFMSESKDSKFPRKERFLQTLKNTNEKGIAATLCTTGGTRATDNFIKIKNATKQGYLEASECDGVDISSRMQYHRGNVQKDKIQTITTSGGNDRGVVVDALKKELCNKLIQDGLVEEGDVVKHSYTQQILDGNKKCVEKNDGNMITLTTRGDCVGTTVKDEIGNLRIRKLTPKECFRLMGVKDEDYENVARNQSNASLYHLAGDSIVCQCLMAIFREMI